jgi:predicted kinase
MNKICIILRGLPRSGKTTHYREKLSHYRHVSADLFFYGRSKTVPQTYDYEPSLIGEAHNFSRQCFREGLDLGENIVVDNTNLTAAEISWYLNEAEDSGYTVHIRTFETDFETCVTRPNEKNIPLNTMADMYVALKSEVLPPWWSVETA